MIKMTYNIIGDIAGRYNELMKLIELMPKADRIILVGDLVDRGPDSKKVIEWAMNTPNVVTLKGNHEDMMVQAYYGDHIDHLNNGGIATLKSYHTMFPSDYPESHIKWMEELPIYYWNNDKSLFVSHAPWHRTYELGEYPGGTPTEFGMQRALWWRDYPKERENVYQIHGHNHLAEIYVNADNEEYGRCIDNCGKKVLTGFSFPDKKIYEVTYD